MWCDAHAIRKPTETIVYKQSKQFGKRSRDSDACCATLKQVYSVLSVFVVSHAHSLSVVYVRSFPLPNEHRLNRFLKISLSLSQRISARVFQCTCFVQQVAFWRGNHRKPRQRANQLWFQPYFSFTVCHTFTLWFFVRKSLFASTRKRHHNSFHFSASLFRSVRSVYGDFHAMRNSKQS